MPPPVGIGGRAGVRRQQATKALSNDENINFCLVALLEKLGSNHKPTSPIFDPEGSSRIGDSFLIIFTLFLFQFPKDNS
jgi:hypothetical protein